MNLHCSTESGTWGFGPATWYRIVSILGPSRIMLWSLVCVVISSEVSQGETNTVASEATSTTETGTLRDPFHRPQPKPAVSQSYGAAVTSAMPLAAIELRGILVVEGLPPSALVRAGVDDSSLIVQAGDLIPLRTKGNKNLGSQQYLIVLEVSPNSITVAPKERPEEIMTIR